MPQPAFRGGAGTGIVVATPNTGGTLTMTAPSATAIGDLFVVCHFYDYHTAADMLTPTAPSGSWTQRGTTADSGSNMMHQKWWTRAVTAAGSQSVTVASTPTDATHMPVLLVFDGTGVTFSFQEANGATGSSSTSHVAPSVANGQTDDMLICCAGESPFGSGTYTWPGSMTERSDVSAGTFSSASLATEILTSNGATGTRTATCTANEVWCAGSLIVRATSSGPVAVSPRIRGIRQAVMRSAVY